MVNIKITLYRPNTEGQNNRPLEQLREDRVESVSCVQAWDTEDPPATPRPCLFPPPPASPFSICVRPLRLLGPYESECAADTQTKAECRLERCR